MVKWHTLKFCMNLGFKPLEFHHHVSENRILFRTFFNHPQRFAPSNKILKSKCPVPLKKFFLGFQEHKKNVKLKWHPLTFHKNFGFKKILELHQSCALKSLPLRQIAFGRGLIFGFFAQSALFGGSIDGLKTSDNKDRGRREGRHLATSNSWAAVARRAGGEPPGPGESLGGGAFWVNASRSSGWCSWNVYFLRRTCDVRTGVETSGQEGRSNKIKQKQCPRKAPRAFPCCHEAGIQNRKSY